MGKTEKKEKKGTYWLKCSCGNEVGFPMKELSEKPTKKECQCGRVWECDKDLNVRDNGGGWYKRTEYFLFKYEDMETIITSRITELNDILRVKYPTAVAKFSHGSRGYSELTEPERFVDLRIEDKGIQSLKKEILDLRRAKDAINDILPKLNSKEKKMFDLLYKQKATKLYIWTTLEIPERTFYREKEKLVRRFAVAIGTLKEKVDIDG